MDITQELLEEVLKRSRHQLENAKKTIENVSDDYIKDIAFEVLKQVLGTDDIDVDTRLKICNYVISNTRGLFLFLSLYAIVAPIFIPFEIITFSSLIIFITS